MSGDNRRTQLRKRVLMPANVSDPAQSIFIKCTVRNADKDGCMIVSSQISDLPDQILIEIANFKGARQGKIVWRKQKTAGVCFD